MSRCEVLAVFAHPDDESLLAGGMLAACAAAGVSVGILSLTRGELGSHAIQMSAESLGELRERELRHAASVLGASWARCLALPDGELASIDRAAAVSAVRALLMASQARVVLSFTAEGLYWHPDHIAAHEIACRAATGTAEVCGTSWPEGLLAGVIDRLTAQGRPAELWGLDPQAFGAPATAIAHELDVSPFLDVKLRALRCHRSQLGPSHALTQLPAELACELLGREWLSAGPATDWLRGVVASGCAAGPGS
jgi:LmbE family N-acetylglucosaminyl deacetylase